MLYVVTTVVDRKREVRAYHNNIPMSVHKARRVIDQIRGRSYQEALMILELLPYRASDPILKLVYSAATNAGSNLNSNEANLIISRARVDGRTSVKKLKPRARGRSYAIKRPSCKIVIVIKDISLSKYNLVDF
uniref:Large ribosomal subunit protein uL22c n=1 Tax=Sinadoxa corydalifolia TaxID=122250 RepID=A0A1J0PL90_9DIPS|nr:ribosomal protein L22 [Sinadoxa corydalifolia]APD52607.1 ribosomal protein L22 [Sinadoxa corydalifolia]